MAQNASGTLIYAGIGYDEEFVGLGLGCKRSIAYDALPEKPHYKPGQAGWEHTRTPEAFFDKLKKEYGNFEVKGEKELYFPDHNLKYFHSTDCDNVEIPGGDVFVRGYLCTSWLPTMKIVECWLPAIRTTKS